MKKAFDAVDLADNASVRRQVFTDEKATAEFGVGKNMVASIRHWATAARIIEATRANNSIGTTPLGKMLFGREEGEGVDPYMENPATLWLIHWQLTTQSNKTTWQWIFNFYSDTTFDTDRMIKSLERLILERNWSKTASNTLKKDVECLIQTYGARSLAKQGSHDDTLASPLIELGLLKSVGNREWRLVRGAKPSLSDGVFAYALSDFWSNHTRATTLSFEAIAHEPGSPGRAFLLGEDELMDRLEKLEKVTKGTLRLSETAGLKQVMRKQALPSTPLTYAECDYPDSTTQEVA